MQQSYRVNTWSEPDQKITDGGQLTCRYSHFLMRRFGDMIPQCAKPNTDSMYAVVWRMLYALWHWVSLELASKSRSESSEVEKKKGLLIDQRSKAVPMQNAKCENKKYTSQSSQYKYFSCSFRNRYIASACSLVYRLNRLNRYTAKLTSG